jgi:NADPH2:quinone reductase
MVLATASSDDRLERLGEFGVDHGVNYAHEDVARRVGELTDGRGVDLVVDPVGGRTLEASIAALAYRGRVSWVGRAGRDPEPPEVWTLMEKNASLTGVFLGAEMGHDPRRVRGLIDRLLQRVASGELRVVIDRIFPLADASAAHAYIESRQAFGRVLLRP